MITTVHKTDLAVKTTTDSKTITVSMDTAVTVKQVLTGILGQIADANH